MKVTPHQARALAALCETGSVNGVCEVLKQKRATVQMILYRCKLANNVSTNIHLAIAWDRYARGEGKQ